MNSSACLRGQDLFNVIKGLRTCWRVSGPGLTKAVKEAVKEAVEEAVDSRVKRKHHKRNIEQVHKVERPGPSTRRRSSGVSMTGGNPAPTGPRLITAQPAI